MILPLLLFAAAAAAQDIGSGKALFSKHCSFCHGANGEGGERAPSITDRNLRTRTDLESVIRDGVPAKGMPPTKIAGKPLRDLAAFVRSIEPAAASRAVSSIRVNGPSFAQVASPAAGEWPTYHGDIGGNRHSPLKQVNASNVAGLKMQWMFSLTGVPRLQNTPVVFDGAMYVTAPNEVHAIDPGTGRAIWRFRRPRTQGLAGDAASGINRGVAILGNRLFFVTDHAHLIALDRGNGKLLWDVAMADHKQNYGATSAPLVVKDLVISGHSGGDEGARGYLAAYRPEDGKEVWRFWTVPAPGEPGSETWKGKDWEHGCGATWLTGTYDKAQDLLLWPVGNPCPDYNGDERQGDNLYSNSVIALDPATGKLRWHFQFTPHDLHDWDATETPMVVDLDGRKRLAHADRNGFLYLLDRETGRPVYVKPFVEKLTWATGVDQRTGRPTVNPASIPTAEGVRACPAVEGATNWFSTAFHPGTGLLYVQALEKCSIYTKAPAVWKAGESHYGGDTKRVPGEQGRKVLRAIDLRTGEKRWEIAQEGPANTWGGVLSTEGGLVFFGHDDGAFAAADARTGKLLWRFDANQTWKASPMTYMHQGRQFIAIAAGSNVLVFGL